jgi:hypothetical protein
MTADEVIDLVHKIDALQVQRSEMDAQIVALKRQLDAAIGGSRRVIFTRPTPVVSNRRSRESPRMSAAVRHIQDAPKADYLSLSDAVYGAQNLKTLKNARTLIFHMKNARMIAGGPGAWRIIQPTDDRQDADQGSLLDT